MSYYEEDDYSRHPQDRYLGAQPRLDQAVYIGRKKFWPKKSTQDDRVFLRPGDYVTNPADRQLVYTGPVHDQSGKIRFIQRNNIHRTSNPRNPRQQQLVENYRSGSWTQRPYRGRLPKQTGGSRHSSLGPQRARSNAGSERGGARPKR